jgi:DNA polymerase I
MKIQILDATYNYDTNGFPVVVLYGITQDGKPVEKHVTGFLPYFYIDHPSLPKAEKYLADLGKQIGIEMRFDDVKRFRPIGFQSKPTHMLKVTVKNPRDTKILKEFCDMDGYLAYETDVIFKDRFMIDHGITGSGWVILPDQPFIKHEDVIGVEDKAKAPMRIMAIDIEALPKDNGGMPTPDVNPIILVSLEFSPPWRGQDNVVMVAKDIGCPRHDVVCSNTETELLKKLSFIVEEYNPDIIAGYNSTGFDLPYITERAEILGVKLKFSRDGKAPYCRSFLGKYSVSITGRIVLDMLPAVKSIDKYRLKSYKLANVAKEILHSEKLDVKPGEMRALWEGPGIAKFISYSRRDSWLVMRMIKELKVMDKYLALSRGSGAFLQVVVNGGQSHMIEAKLSREFKAEHRLMGTKTAMDEDDMAAAAITGAIVLPPDIGLTEDVDILDYKSLYPTIMMAYNLCYTTEIRDEQPDCENIVSPCGGKFVPHSHYLGIIPRILKKLLSERIAAKKAMKTAATDEERDALDAKQQAMKILLNSFYGYTGYTRARLFSHIIANSVTSYGRENLLRTCKIVEEHENFELEGKKYVLRVVSGDTDSVFISIKGGVDFETAQKIGKEMAKIITAGLPEPMELVFEAFAKRLLVVAKKHYAMYRFESPDKGVIKAKGIETVRRDWCNLTASTLTRCLELILIDGDTNKALDHARKALNDVKAPNPDTLKDLVLTRTLTMKPESYKQVQPHSELVKKLEERGIHKYVIGDRIPFIIVKGNHRKGKRKELMTARAEDPEYVLTHGLKIDTDYYVEKQLLPPLSRIFASFGIGAMDLMRKSRQQTLFS